MPIGFWNDPDGSKYHAAYFEHYPGVWRHGDYVELTEHDGLIIYGRSDASSTPAASASAPRRSTARSSSSTRSSRAWWSASSGITTSASCCSCGCATAWRSTTRCATRIRRRSASDTTPRHVPARIVQVPDIPRTKSGKIVELAVRDVVHGRAVKNREALANPEALEYFRDRAELTTEPAVDGGWL